MISVIQRVSHARVEVGGKTVGEVGADMKVHLVNDGPVTIPLTVR